MNINVTLCHYPDKVSALFAESSKLKSFGEFNSAKFNALRIKIFNCIRLMYVFNNI